MFGFWSNTQCNFAECITMAKELWPRYVNLDFSFVHPDQLSTTTCDHPVVAPFQVAIVIV
jgi:hypothetical protein